MNASAKAVVLLMIDELGGRVRSKTLVMKYVYFLKEKLGLEDLEFRPHYYGPYSEEVADTVSQLAQLGFVDEKCQLLGYDERGFERCRYSYSLTEDGKVVVEATKKRLGEAARGLTEVIDELDKAANGMNYMDVSYAAKTHLLLKEAKKPMTVDEIREEASRLSWRMAAHDVEKSVRFLKEIGLASTT
ncbi:MAG TPA: hypothetical protein VMH22_00540 [bacterium]|nr:hypothetical protein [bacterium]